MKRTLPICIDLLLVLTTACSPSGAASTSQAGSVSNAPAEPVQTTDPIPDQAAKPLNQFHLDVTLDTQAHQLKVKQTLTYYNHTGKPLSQIYFNLIPQAFQQDGGGTVVERVSVLVAQGKGAPYFLTGGLCDNGYFVERLGARLGEPVATESRARFAGAVGAALLAAEGEGRRS